VDLCGAPCNDVCDSLGLALDITDAEWLAAQDTLAECQAIGDAFDLPVVSLDAYSFACLEEDAAADLPGLGLLGTLYCSTDMLCPQQHRTSTDTPGVACGTGGSFRGICPCN
jgi:hypothetical protein